jgi:biopolymer transport protein ExbB
MNFFELQIYSYRLNFHQDMFFKRESSAGLINIKQRINKPNRLTWGWSDHVLLRKTNLTIMLNFILLQLTVGADTTAQAAAAVPAPTEETLSLWELATKGGLIMIPLALMSVLAIYIFIERYMLISKAGKEDTNFMNNIRDYIHGGKIDSARTLCKGTDTPISHMIEKGISRIGKPLGDITAAVENVGKLEIAKLERNVAFLSTTAGAAPMLGFLGTVTGMIKAFYKMSKAGNNIDVSILSGGIYEAMVTTVAGLVVGIIAYICYNILVSKIEKVVNKMETRTIEFVDLLHEPA